MGQVPRYGIIGDGRLATHFAHYLSLSDVPYRQWSRKHEARGECLPVEPELQECETVLVLIHDRAIDPFLENHSRLLEKRVVHCSGCHVSRFAIGLHPLMTFGPELYALETYRTIAFIEEASPQGPHFRDVFPMLSNPVFQIEAAKKPLYHAYCVIGGNLPVLLWRRTLQQMSIQFGIPKEALLPYFRRMFENFEASPEKALTGPIARGDSKTIAANLDALDAARDPYGDVYEACVRAAFLHGTAIGLDSPQSKEAGV